MTNALMQIKKLPGSAHFNEVQYLIDDYINLCIRRKCTLFLIVHFFNLQEYIQTCINPLTPETPVTARAARVSRAGNAFSPTSPTK